MKTIVVNPSTIQREWYVVDASTMTLGRLASRVAGLLIGKAKPAFSPNQDHGDNVIVINAAKVRLTGKKPQMKFYFRHSTRPGGGTMTPYAEQMAKDPTRVILHAVHGMVSKGSLGKAIMKKLHVYADDKHPHAGQKPQAKAY